MARLVADIQECLGRITASSGFSNSERIRELLRYTVGEALQGRGGSLKESVLGVSVFRRKPGYDSDADSIVRASRRSSRTINPTTFELISQNSQPADVHEFLTSLPNLIVHE